MNANIGESKEDGIKVIHQSSFFDTPSLKSKVFQTFNTKKNPNPFTKDNPIYSKGFLFKKNFNNQSCKKRFFLLAEDGIYYGKDSNPASISKYMVYENTRVVFDIMHESTDKKKTIKDYKYILKFFRNYYICEIGTDDADLFSFWRKFLAYKCIQHTFHEEFEVKKMIGKGSFAKVLFYYYYFFLIKIFFRFTMPSRKKTKRLMPSKLSIKRSF